MSLGGYYAIYMDSLETLHVDLMCYENALLLNEETLITHGDKLGNGPSTIFCIKTQCTIIKCTMLGDK